MGGPDAYVGMIGLGCIKPGQVALITGSSHLHLLVTDSPKSAPGVWGAYVAAPLQNLCFAEGGQSSTGSIISWARNLLGNNDSYATLDEEAAAVPIGAEGVLALETFQGARTPKTDSLARGALFGLSLAHTRGHIWRALLEAVVLGTRACLEGLMKISPSPCDGISVAGGATRSNTWLQMHADATGLPIMEFESDNAPLLGGAVLAAVGAGIYTSVEEAVNEMVHFAVLIEPDQNNKQRYDELYKIYGKATESIRPISHDLSLSTKTEKS
jgi:ribulose kinase